MRGRKGDRQTETDRQTDRHTYRQTDRHVGKERKTYPTCDKLQSKLPT